MGRLTLLKLALCHFGVSTSQVRDLETEVWMTDRRGTAALKVPSECTRGLPFLITVVQLCHQGHQQLDRGRGSLYCPHPPEQVHRRPSPVSCPPAPRADAGTMLCALEPSAMLMHGPQTANALRSGSRPKHCSKTAFPKHKPPSATKTNRYAVKDHCIPCHRGWGGKPPSQGLTHTDVALH